MLIGLFLDYVNDPTFREEFRDNPAAILDRLGISPADRDLLRAKDEATLRVRLHAEADELVTKAYEIADREHLEYPISSPVPATIVPNQGPVMTLIKFEILGKWLVSVGKVYFGEVEANNLKLVNQANMGSVLQGQVMIPMAGHCQVKLVPNNPDLKSSLVPGGFTAV